MTVSPVRIRTRLVLVLVVPALLLVAGVAVEGSAGLRARSEAAAVARHVTVVLAVQDLVHALQRERSLLAALLSGEGRVRADLPAARDATDRARAALSRLLATRPPTSYAPVRETLARLPALDRARTATPVLATAPDTPAAPGGPPPRAPRSGLAPATPLPGPFGAPVTPGAAIAPEDSAPSRRSGPAIVPQSARSATTRPHGTALSPVGHALNARQTANSPAQRPAPATADRTMSGMAPSPAAPQQAGGAGRGTSDPSGAGPGRPSREGDVASTIVGSLPGLAGATGATPAPRTTDGPADTPDDHGSGDAPVGLRGRHVAEPGGARVEKPGDRGPGVRREVFEAFTDAIAGLTDGVFATRVGGGDPGSVRRLQALEAISRAKEAAARERAVVTAAFATGAFTRPEYVTFLEARASLAEALAGFRRVATPEGVAELERAQRGAQAARTGKLERRALAASPGRPVTSRTRAWLAASSAYVDALRTVQRSAGHDLRSHAVEAGERQTRRMAWLAGLGAAVLLVLAGLGALMVRSVTRPLRRITGEATALARHIAALEAADSLRSGELRRAYDASLQPVDDSYEGEEQADGGEAAEFGRLAGALGDVQQAAVRIAAGQAAIRRDAAESLGGLGTRHRDLAHRQLAFIGALQRNESDPAVLARLCELDRVTSRLRRNAESLLVLTGRRGSRRSSEPVPVDEVLRSVLAEVEDHQRVELRVAGRAHVRGAVVAEVAHMLAELVENALVFSPPDARVEVVSRATEGECRVTIADYGAGMTGGELAATNARLRGEQSFLVAPTRCLGHHVVGRLAERLGVRVSLHASPGCGVTALVVLPEELLDARPAELLEDSR